MVVDAHFAPVPIGDGREAAGQGGQGQAGARGGPRRIEGRGEPRSQYDERAGLPSHEGEEGGGGGRGLLVQEGRGETRVRAPRGGHRSPSGAPWA